jgi:hypothetical protein
MSTHVHELADSPNEERKKYRRRMGKSLKKIPSYTGNDNMAGPEG